MSKFEREQVFKYPQTLICGYGIVGKHLKNEFKFAETYDLDIDMKADFTEPPAKHYDICFISVPTPNTENVCNTRYVEEALKEVDSDIYILKSTVPPTTTGANVFPDIPLASVVVALLTYRRAKRTPSTFIRPDIIASTCRYAVADVALCCFT
jgi:hypothetical protein